MKKLFVAAMVLTAATPLAAQDKFGPSDLGLSPDMIRSIDVRIADKATGACWTNLKEVREYAEEKLRSKNYNVVDDLQMRRAPDFTFWVGVGAQRDPIDTCDGSISISVHTVAQVDKFFGTLVLTPQVAVSVSSAAENLNRRVLEAVQEMIDEM